jgi:hypothetical protein
MRTVRTRGSSIVAVTITALSRIDSDAPRPLSRGIITAVGAPGLSIRSALPCPIGRNLTHRRVSAAGGGIARSVVPFGRANLAVFAVFAGN